MWHRSALRQSLQAELRPGECLLGDSGYPLEPWLLTPVPGHPPPGTPESCYNKHHAAMHNVVERCIGVLKSRLRCLQCNQTLLYNPDRAGIIIAACAALHNIALAAREPAPDDDLPPPPLRVPAPEEVALGGELQRACAVNLFWGQQGGNADHLRRVRRRMKRQRTA